MHLWHISLQSLSDLDFDLTRSSKVKCDGAIGLSICELLLVSNSNTWRNSAPLRDISLQNWSDLDSDLSSSRKSHANRTDGHPIYNFLLMFNSSIWPNSYTRYNASKSE